MWDMHTVFPTLQIEKTDKTVEEENIIPNL